nr:endonuclease/exonuclease/phosphatase family protein [uncultured Rhodoferax sp.]
MKIVTWNCNGALRKKTPELDALDADVYVVQECEDPAHSTEAFRDWAGAYLWVGTSKHKGLGIFPKKGNTVRALDWFGTFSQQGVSNSSAASSWTTTELKLFTPFTLNEEFQVLGVWTKADGAKVFRYIGQLWKYLQIHRNQLHRRKTILLGDFNSNRIWDKPDRWWNHSDVVEELESIGLQSVYHLQTVEAQGQESTPTFFLQRNVEKAYHIDYVFVSRDLLDQSNVKVGEQKNWLGVSDHMPVMLEIHRGT